MLKRTLMLTVLAGVLAVPAGYASAADQERTKDDVKVQPQDQEEQIYGSQLMTPEEQSEHRTRMRSLKTPEEREAYRLEHHRKMQERAKQAGVTLPEEPPVPGGGMGQTGSGGGRGMGPGGGGRNR